MSLRPVRLRKNAWEYIGNKIRHTMRDTLDLTWVSLFVCIYLCKCLINLSLNY